MTEALAPVLGRIPSGLFILTAAHPQNDDETGMLASWVQQASFEPPAVTVAVNRKRYLADWLQPGRPLTLNLLGETQKSLLGHFGRGFEPGEDAFQGIQTARSPSNLPVLTEALGWMEGTVASQLDAGDHVILLVKLSGATAGDRLTQERPYVHIRKNGMSY